MKISRGIGVAVAGVLAGAIFAPPALARKTVVRERPAVYLSATTFSASYYVDPGRVQAGSVGLAEEPLEYYTAIPGGLVPVYPSVNVAAFNGAISGYYLSGSVQAMLAGYAFTEEIPLPPI